MLDRFRATFPGVRLLAHRQHGADFYAIGEHQDGRRVYFHAGAHCSHTFADPAGVDNPHATVLNALGAVVDGRYSGIWTGPK